MATFLYGEASQNFATGQWNWPTLTVWGLLVSSAYVPLINADTSVASIPAAAIIARVGPMTSLGASNGICKGTLPQFLSLLSTVPAAAIVLYIKGASDAASPLIYYSSDGIGFPITLEGFNYAVANDLSLGGWFQV